MDVSFSVALVVSFVLVGCSLVVSVVSILVVAVGFVSTAVVFFDGFSVVVGSSFVDVRLC